MIYFYDLPEKKQDDLKKELREDAIANWWSTQEDKGVELCDYTLTDEEDQEIDNLVEDYIRRNDDGVLYEI